MRLEFKKQMVSRQEIIDALEDILRKLREQASAKS